MKKMALAVFVLALVACGGPKANDKCDAASEGKYLCADATSALECRDGTWQSLPCRGPEGCRAGNKAIACDMRGNYEGDPCPADAVGKGYCAPDGKSTLECRERVIKRTNSCISCTLSSDGTKSICQPM